MTREAAVTSSGERGLVGVAAEAEKIEQCDHRLKEK